MIPWTKDLSVPRPNRIVGNGGKGVVSRPYPCEVQGLGNFRCRRLSKGKEGFLERREWRDFPPS